MRFLPFSNGAGEHRLLQMQKEVPQPGPSLSESEEILSLSPELRNAQNRAGAAHHFSERFVLTPLQALGKKADLNDLQKVQGIYDALVPAEEGGKLLGDEQAPAAQELTPEEEEQEAAPEETAKEETPPEADSPPPETPADAPVTVTEPAAGEAPEAQTTEEERAAPPPLPGDTGGMSEQELLDAIHAFTGVIYPLVKQNEEAQELHDKLQAQVNDGKGDDGTAAQIASLEQDFAKREQEIVGHREHRKQFEEALRAKLERGSE
ncbi:MAG: hypothetical protein WCV62_05250 [Candidatus Peribacteraceae bacterium]|jgi:outer membrane biosynthesis protein TonB